MNNKTIYLGITNTLKGPQIPVVHTFDTRLDIFINRYGKMYDSDCYELVKLDAFSKRTLVHVYCMGQRFNKESSLNDVLTIQQINAIKRIQSELGLRNVIFAPELRGVSNNF